MSRSLCQCFLFFFASFILVILIVVLFVWFRLSEPLDIPPSRIGFLHVLPQLKTGDLLAISYSSIRGKLVKVFTGSMWTHLGLVYRNRQGEIYVIEAALYPDKEGVLRTPLSEWKSWNMGRIVAYASLIGPPISDEAIEDALSKVSGCSVDMFVLNWFLTTFRLEYREGHRGKFFCSELVAYLLQQLGVIEKQYRPTSYSPKDFIFSRIKMSPSYSYQEPYHILL